MEIDQGSSRETEKELRKRRLEELKRKRELKQAAMNELSRGSGAVSAGTASFSNRPLPTSRPSMSVTTTEVVERRMPTGRTQSFETPIRQTGTSSVAPKYSIVAGQSKVAKTSKRAAVSPARRDKKDKYVMYLERGAWVFCLFLCIRLLFADRGIVDYYQTKSQLNDRENSYMEISSDNQDLIKEIALLQSDKGYQKHIIRGHLGFIAGDEYLLLVD